MPVRVTADKSTYVGVCFPTEEDAARAINRENISTKKSSVDAWQRVCEGGEQRRRAACF